MVGQPPRPSRSILSRRVRLDTSFTSGHISVRPRLSIAMPRVYTHLFVDLYARLCVLRVYLLTIRARRVCVRVCVCVCVRTSRESRGELRGCGQSDALPQNREGPDPTGIERGTLAPHTITPRDRREVELLEYRRYRALNASITINIEMR